ncbi:glycoside hydrolase, partial [Candidatus Saccharibacteria bacterium]|nr:glycoside hydrolase [Candidatus Saccharibacteria bacterium]
QNELRSLLRGQWSNGMLPHMIFSNDPDFERDRQAWRSWVSPYSPEKVSTSGITQPPMLAEAVVQIGQRLKAPERRRWYDEMWQPLVNHHRWVYQERDPHQEGLALLIHPWECGMDNTPPWMAYLQDHQLPLWINFLHTTKLETVVGLFRRDTRSVPANQRFTNYEVLGLYSDQLRLRRKGYNIDRILDHALFAIEDLTFNSILIRANRHLQDIAAVIKEDLPEDLLERMHKTEKAFDQLWDETTGQYYSRDFTTHKWLRESTIATLLPLYAGHISKERAKSLVKLIENPGQFGLDFPLPSVPQSSGWFDPNRYWQGPSWINMNWLVIEGLKRYGFDDHAQVITELSIEMVAEHGNHEYFNPQDGSPLGAENFSWTAALTIDLLNR